MKIDKKACLTVGVSVFLLFLAIRYWPIAETLLTGIFAAAMPLLAGLAIAYIANIPMTFYERYYFPKSKKPFVQKSRRPVCLTLSFLSILAIIALIIGLILPQLISCIKLVASMVPDAAVRCVDWLKGTGLVSEETYKALASLNWNDVINRALEFLTSGLGNVMDVVINTVTAVVSGVVTAFVAIVFSIYLLLSKETLCRQVKKLVRHIVKPTLRERGKTTLDVLNDCFHRYIVGQCTEAIILGVLCMVGMFLLRLPYATMISALVAFTALIPVAGAYIGAVVGAFMILTESPIQALVFLGFLLILQQIEGNLIYPRVVGSSLDLPALWVLAAITVGGGLLGITGMLLGVPLTATAYRLLRAELNKAEANAGSSENPCEKIEEALPETSGTNE